MYAFIKFLYFIEEKDAFDIKCKIKAYEHGFIFFMIFKNRIAY